MSRGWALAWAANALASPAASARIDSGNASSAMVVVKAARAVSIEAPSTRL